MIGKTNLDEFCMGSSTTHSVHGPTINPLSGDGEQLISGGSSGGTAAAIACGSALAGLGTDTGGSVRQPAAMCGIVGFKPSYGAISRWGVVAMASSLDTVGIMARRVEDVAAVFEAIRGPDAHDGTAAPKSAISESPPSSRIPSLVVGMSPDFYPEEMSPQIANIWFHVARGLGWDGNTTIPMPHTRAALSCYYVISSAEASSNLARYDGVRYGHRAQGDVASVSELIQRSRGQSLGPNTLKRILMGSFVLSRESYDAFFVQAQRVRRLVLEDFERAFEKCDFLLVPTVASSRIPAVKEIQQSETPIEEWCGDLLTVSASLAGLPAISVPAGPAPVSLQIIGPRFSDFKVLQLAERVEKIVATLS